MTKDIGQLRNNLEDSIKHLEDINEELNQDLDKLENDLKMGLEEEKMLRGQDIGILKFNLNEGNTFNHVALMTFGFLIGST